MNPVVRNITNNCLYIYKGNDEYKNIHSNVVGYVKPEIAGKVFKINAEMTYVINTYPQIEELIRRLDLKLEK